MEPNDNGTLSSTEEQERDDIWKALYETHKIDEEVKFNEFNIGDKLKEHPFIKLNYENLYYKEQAKYVRMTEVFEKIQGLRYDYYRFNFSKELTNKEIEKYYLPKDPTILEAKKKLRKQQWNMDFYKMCVDAITNQGWRMKEFLDSLKIT
jgi:hypothetical protein